MALAVAGPRITPASAFFMNELTKMEPGTEYSGIYANKPGYHGTRAENDSRSGVGKDYSCRAPLDRKGPADKAAAYDWTFHSAQGGNYARMSWYGDSLELAFKARDPRLFGWREALGQTDTDKAPEGLDFQGWYTRVPDSTHSWHWHLSEVRAFVESMDNKHAMLSVLRRETLAAYRARGGVLLGTAPTPTPAPSADWMDLLVKTRLPLLKQGSNDTFSIRLAQAALNVHGYGLKEDGDFGAKTRAAVVAIQKKYGAESRDGSIGPETWTIILTRKDQV
jgi:hypothetical protein